MTHHYTIENCARCGKTHETKFKKLKKPIPSDDKAGQPWTHWASCANTGEPILMRKTK